MGWITAKCSKCDGSGYEDGKIPEEPHYADRCSKCLGVGMEQINEDEARYRLLQKQIDDAKL